MEIWHNPRCSKSRAAKQALDTAGVEYVERRYLDDAPTVAELAAVLDKMGAEPWDITRLGEARAKELGLAALPRDREVWLEVLAANPVLVERPIIVTGTTAFVARTEEAVRSLG
ncbi:arsenate reductase family protein [Umezawaea endophytica]|uniref:Arsenate reductase family protein n=1 Tax=Umezawaea endophytica TaxID=1654476 RepID=A0A9X2VN42_9PSEU|nr:arsenate reductase family protein [Umezawaea endophytica]MCS7479721.1 arsenate reductase family protein [Umezawaea endophytica]